MTLTVLDTTSAFVNCSSVRRKWTHARKQSVLFFICFDAINATVKLYIKQLKVGQEVYAVRTIMQLYERRFRKIALHPRKACFILTKSFWQKKHTQSKQNHEWNSAWDFKRLFLRFIFICMNNNNCEAKIKFAFHEKLLLIIMSLKKLSSFNLMKKFNWSEKPGDDDEMRKRSSWEQFSLLKWRLWKWKMTKENNFLKRISE